MVDELEAMLSADLVLQMLDLIVLKFNNIAAAETDQMIVMMVSHMLKLRHTAAKLPLQSKPGLGQELEGPIDRRIPDLRIELAGPPPQLLDGQMLMLLKEFLNDDVPLPGRLETLFGNVVLILGKFIFVGHNRLPVL